MRALRLKLLSFYENSYMNLLNSVLILFTVALLILTSQFPAFYQQHVLFFDALSDFILLFFCFDFICRIYLNGVSKKYLFSFNGAVDFFAFAPELILRLFGIPISIEWLRSIRLIRLLKIKSIKPYDHVSLGVFAKLLPYLITAFALKSVTVAFERNVWWPKLDDINVILGVIGFTLAISLGSKLTVVNNRIRMIEDTVCQIVGALRDIEHRANLGKELKEWSLGFETALKTQTSKKSEQARIMRHMTDNLARLFVKEKISGPNTVSFHRDVALVLHRMTAKTPESFDRFLKVITAIYAIVLIVTLPGLTGFVSTALIVVSLGGLFIIIDDMDDPLNYYEGSLIDVNLEALEQYNNKRHSRESSFSNSTVR